MRREKSPPFIGVIIAKVSRGGLIVMEGEDEVVWLLYLFQRGERKGKKKKCVGKTGGISQIQRYSA